MNRIRVCLIGISGSGKTAQLFSLMSKLCDKGIPCRYIHNGGGSFRAVSLPLLYFLKIFEDKQRNKTSICESCIRHPNLAHTGDFLVSIWIFLFAIDMFILAMIYSFYSIRARIVLFDRYIFDAVVDLMISTRDSVIHNRHLPKLLLFSTYPDIVLFLDVKEEIALARIYNRNRKTQVTLGYLQKRNFLLRKIVRNMSINMVDANKSFVDVQKDIINHIQELTELNLPII